MNSQEQQFFNTRWFQIALLAALAVAVMTAAAYFFGTGLRADTERSVAASPLGSSLTAIRESRLDDYYGRFSDASAAARLAALMGSRSDDYYARFSNATAAAKLAVLAGSRLDDYYARLSDSAAAARAASLAGSRLDDYYGRLTAGMSAAQFAARFGIPAAAGPTSSEQSSSPIVKSSGADLFHSIKPQGIRPAAASGAN